ncbi:hypothetical protein [Luteococcus sp.]|uniref:hypothetical protein n=1 Tax=Luteococcus sp. TaxID=1969402 RepID=UPI0037366C0A
MPNVRAVEHYNAWNAAIAEVLFPVREDEVPVYLDLEAGELEGLAEAVGVPVAEVETRLFRAVAETLDCTGSRRETFRYHRYRLQRFHETRRQQGNAEDPPYLALLAVFSLAAEEMAQDEEFCAANYYGRLGKILGIDDGDRVREGYVSIAADCWKDLNTWLSSLDGARGEPTAFPLRHAHVGYALSQALVRKIDRERLRSFFVSRHLAPGALVTGGGLVDLLDEWISSQDCRATDSLKRLWQQPATRDRIAEITATELANWDGRVADARVVTDGGDLGERIILRAGWRTFPTRKLDVSAIVYAFHPHEARDATIATEGAAATVPLIPDGLGALRLGDHGQLGSENLITGLLEVKDSLTHTVVRRRPRRLVVLRKDELGNGFKEVDQAMLSDDHLLLAHVDLVARLQSFLEQVARPGWEVLEEGIKGLPDGWVPRARRPNHEFPSAHAAACPEG